MNRMTEEKVKINVIAVDEPYTVQGWFDKKNVFIDGRIYKEIEAELEQLKIDNKILEAENERLRKDTNDRCELMDRSGYGCGLTDMSKRPVRMFA
jgi:excinuclease UvrABC helicase subunit UvrB